MHPILLKIGKFELHTYGLMMMLSFLVGIYFSVKKAKKEGVDPNSIVDLVIVIIISSLIGARLLYVMFHFNEFSNNLLDIINPLQSDGSIGIAGMSILGGILMASIASYVFLKKRKLPVLKVFNFMVPMVALGIGITRIGCFFQGCCFGQECNLPFGVVFPAGSPAGFSFPDIPLYPTQLFASAAGFIIFGLLIWSSSIERFKDKTFVLFMILLGISRIIVDIFRYREESVRIFNLFGQVISTNQIISFLMVIGGLAGYMLLNKMNKKT